MAKKMLVVAGGIDDAENMEGQWKSAGFEVRIASHVSDAATDALQWEPDLILLDFDGDPVAGAKFLRHLQRIPRLVRTPVLMISPEDRAQLPKFLLRCIQTILESPVLAN